MQYQAHRGVGTEFPENTIPAFIAAIEQRYAVIEADPCFTADGVCVLLHDRTLNRTCRLKDGSPLNEDIAIDQITYEQAQTYDAGLAKAPKFRGTTIPTLQSLFELVEGTDVLIKLDNRIQSFDPKETETLFQLVESSTAKIAFTVSDFSYLERVLKRFPHAQIHYDGAVDESNLQRLCDLVPREQRTVWLCLPSKDTAWVRVPTANPTLCTAVKRCARLGLWILRTPEQLHIAEQYQADYIETPGELKPIPPYSGLADCHIHTVFSHDSMTEPSELVAQAAKHPLSAIAFTDHCDIEFCQTIDEVTPIRHSVEAAQTCQVGSASLDIHTGVEIGEGIWHMDVTDKLIHSEPFDVVLGSVHAVRYPGYSMPYSRIDFSAFPANELPDFLAAYFNDLLEMAQTADFDVLTHLTCPLRYIQGKYGLPVQMAAYDEVIGQILQTIIDRGIALEVNTSGMRAPSPFLMPDVPILQRYLAIGGTLLTLGSDAHIAANVANGFEETVAILKKLGVQWLCSYRRRIAIPYAI